MKVLGLSFGRKNGNCDIVIKQALYGAREAGAEITFINTCNLRIDRCTGCGGCDRRREKGGPSLCIIKDDFPFVENEILDADALLVAAPVYVLGPVGQYKNLCDRMGPSHDRAFMLKENRRRIENGMAENELLDPRLFKDRFVGLVSVGGARTENWTSFGLSGMHLLTFSMQMTVVDQINLYGMGDRVHPALDAKLMDRLLLMGKHVVSAIGKPREKAEWQGDEPGICPHCHCDLLTIKKGLKVECPVCGIRGILSISNGEIKVDFPAEELEHSRLRPLGVEDHCNEINDMMYGAQAVLKKDGDKIPGLIKHLEGIKTLKPLSK